MLICLKAEKITDTEWQKFEMNRTSSKEVMNVLNMRSVYANLKLVVWSVDCDVDADNSPICRVQITLIYVFLLNRFILPWGTTQNIL